ncbi:MAG: zinc ribbon domain-containing protein [Planctomycetota bacterium]|jgi:gas vesicle protein
MAISVTCANLKCGAVFEVGLEAAGTTAQCPRCGSPTPVPAGAGPALQQCPNCGAAFTGAADVCPECGADIRGHGVAVLKPKRKFNALPLLIGGGIFVGLGILIALILFAVKLMAERREAAAEKSREAAERAERLAAEKKTKTKAPVVVEELEALAAQEKEIQEAVSAYKGRLRDVLSQVRTATPDEMARLWTDLYAFCRDNGLATEGDQCWARAVLLRPTDAEVNSKLGRTESFSSIPVTPEQKQFLTSLQLRLVLVNLHPGLADHTARVNGQGEVPLSWGEPAELLADAGPVRVAIAPRAGAEGPTYALALETVPALVYTVHLEQPLAAPPPPFGALRDIYSAVAERAARRGVTVERDRWNKPVSARAPNLRVDGLDGEPLRMQLSRSTGMLTIAGTVKYGNRHDQTGEHVLFGDADQPLRLIIDGSQETVSLRSGGYYRLQVDLADGLWGALGVAEGDFASEWARRKLAQHFEEVSVENEAMEASGKFDGVWQVVGRTYGRMDSRRREVEAELRLRNRAGRTPHYLDRARALRVKDRQEHLYMNWPRFRLAMASVTAQARGAILRRLNEMATRAEEGEEESRRPGAPRWAREGPWGE